MTHFKYNYGFQYQKGSRAGGVRGTEGFSDCYDEGGWNFFYETQKNAFKYISLVKEEGLLTDLHGYLKVAKE